MMECPRERKGKAQLPVWAEEFLGSYCSQRRKSESLPIICGGCGVSTCGDRDPP